MGVVIVHTGHIQLHIGLISFGGDAGAKIGFQHGLYRVKTVLLGAGFQLLGAAVQLSLGSLGNGIASGLCIQAHGLILGPGLEGVVQEELLPGHGGAGHAAGLLVQGLGSVQTNVGNIAAIVIEEVVIGPPVEDLEQAVAEGGIAHRGYGFAQLRGDIVPFEGIVLPDQNAGRLCGLFRGGVCGGGGGFSGFCGKALCRSSQEPNGDGDEGQNQDCAANYQGELFPIHRLRLGIGSLPWRRKVLLRGGGGLRSLLRGEGNGLSLLRQAVVPATAGADGIAILQGGLAVFTIHELTSFLPWDADRPRPGAYFFQYSTERAPMQGKVPGKYEKRLNFL